MRFLIVFGTFVVSASLVYFIVWGIQHSYHPTNRTELLIVDEIGKPHYLLRQNGQDYPFDLVDPDSAPENIWNEVHMGFQIFQNTLQMAPQYAGDAITCNNCHFGGGNSLGGKNCGISLVGVSKQYPRYSERLGKEITLADRINLCFTRSLNGHPLPLGSTQMKALVAYLDWISYEVRDIPHIPWLGLKKITIDRQPDLEKGAKLFTDHCTACHGMEGEGTEQAPPLWGSHSFNAEAGMYELPTLASFVFDNMPHNHPSFTQDEAVDVSGYILSKPRDGK